MTQSRARISVLLVEDHHVTMEGMHSWMEKATRFQVVGKCSNAAKALELAKATKAQVTLLDLHLPGDHRIEELIRSLVETGTKVVIFSGESRKYFVDLALKCGAAAFVSKEESYFTISQVISDVCTVEGRFISPSLQQAYRQRFTEAEQEILALLAKGKKYEEISSIRLTSIHTVRKQCDNLLNKLRLTSREELIAWSVANGYRDAAEPVIQTPPDLEK